MDITALENYLWEAACSIRGPIDASKFKDYILSPSRYVSANDGEPPLPVEEALVLLAEADKSGPRSMLNWTRC